MPLEVHIENGHPEEEEVLFWVQHYIEVFELEKWDILLRFYPNKEVPTDMEIEESGGATCCPRPQYRQATIYVNVDKISNLDELRLFVRHEIIHIVQSWISCAADDLVTNKAGGKYIARAAEASVEMLENLDVWDLVDKDAIKLNLLLRL